MAKIFVLFLLDRMTSIRTEILNDKNLFSPTSETFSSSKDRSFYFFSLKKTKNSYPTISFETNFQSKTKKKIISGFFYMAQNSNAQPTELDPQTWKAQPSKHRVQISRILVWWKRWSVGDRRIFFWTQNFLQQVEKFVSSFFDLETKVKKFDFLLFVRWIDVFTVNADFLRFVEFESKIFR